MTRTLKDRILWNRRPTGPRDTGDIDEIVVHDCTVHVEQMDERCWWIGITKAGSDRQWMGVFTADSWGRMRFAQTDDDGIEWAIDHAHETGASRG